MYTHLKELPLWFYHGTHGVHAESGRRDRLQETILFSLALGRATTAST